MGERIVFGVMTGTSLDGVDAAAVRVEGEGLGMRVGFVRGESGGLGGARETMAALAGGGGVSAGEVGAARLAYGEAVAAVVGRVVEGLGARPALVALSGQTVFHLPPVSWQVCDPWAVARSAGCPVVYDLRGADLASGGEGAPITPLADWVLFRCEGVGRAVVNLGGFCNVTLLGAGGGVEEVEGFDVCACNLALNMAARAGLGRAFDEGGEAALGGSANRQAVDQLAMLLGAQVRRGRSLGQEWGEVEPWVEGWSAGLSGGDLVASAAAGVGRVIGETVRARAGEGAEVVLAGGGVRNRALVGAIGSSFGGAVAETGDLGVPVEFREAACMGVLGAMAADGVEVTLPRVTGGERGVLMSGAWVNARVRL